MKRALGIAAWVVGGLMLLIAAGVAYLLTLLSPANVRAEVERAVEAATGRDLTIKGEVGVSLWPVFGVRAQGVTLANVPGGTAQSLLEARAIQVGVAVAPLLNRVIEVHEIVLEGPQLALEVDAKGAPNWVFKPAASTAPSNGQGQATQSPPPLTVHTLRVESGRISFSNAQTGQSALIDAVSLDSALTGFDKPMRIDASGVYNAEDVRVTATIARPGVVFDGAETGLQFVLEAAPVKAQFDGLIQLTAGTLKGALEANGPSLRRLSAWTGTALGDGATLQSFAIKGALSRDAITTRFENASITLDGVQARGDFMLETSGKKPLISGRLEVMGINLNPYLMVAKPTGATAAVEIAAIDVDKPGWDDSTLDLSGLGALNAALELTISGPTLVQKLTIDRLKADVSMTDGVMSVSMSEMLLYGGIGSGRLSINTRDASLSLASELAVEGVKADQFLESFIGFNQLSAPAKVNFAIASVGRSQKALMENLRGVGDFQFGAGALRGVNLGGVARTIGNLLDGSLVGPQAQTAFNGFNASFRIERGVAATRDFALENREMRLTAIGAIDIGKQSLDLRLTPASIIGRNRDGGAATGIGLPFVVKGPWAKPEYGADLLGGARQGVERRVCDVLGKSVGPRVTGC